MKKIVIFGGSGLALAGLLVGAAFLNNPRVEANESAVEESAVDTPAAVQEFLNINNDPLMGDEMSKEQIEAAFIPDEPGETRTENEDGTVHIYDEGYVFEDRSDEVWNATALMFMQEQALPSGIYFPNTAPKFFKPGELSLIEHGVWEEHLLPYNLFRQFVTKYWSCAWIDTQAGALASGDLVLVDAAQQEILKYKTVTGTEAVYSGYEEFKRKLLDTADGDPYVYNELWFDRECKTYRMEVVKR